MGLWATLASVFTRRDPAARDEAERVLLEADFGVAATTAIMDRLAHVPDAELEPALERIVSKLVAAAGDPAG
ncbi:MAG: hypothetical protein HYS40_03960 [Gemmatimonadetes bacterium]|nr:hypothetical protein [Gemmatimonadota bacterium]